jgi:hypothetical protein
VAVSTASNTQAAQARCRLGIEAYSLACDATCGVVSHAPHVRDSATTSRNPAPGSSRGGATGTRTNTARETTLTDTSTVRARRYWSGART